MIFQTLVLLHLQYYRRMTRQVVNKNMTCLVFSSPIDAEGIAAEPDRHYVCADLPEAMARAIVRLLDSPDERADLADRARLLAEARYGWDTAGQTLADVIQEAARGR